MNDGINAQWYSLEYTTVNKIVTVVAQLGRDAIQKELEVWRDRK